MRRGPEGPKLGRETPGATGGSEGETGRGAHRFRLRPDLADPGPRGPRPMSGAETAAAPPALPGAGATALFLDFDGTLVDLADHPEGVAVAPGLLALLGGLERALGGALAIVTGRQIEVVDRFLAPLVLPVAGVHGLERRDAAGRLHHPDGDPQFVELLAERLAPLLARAPELVLERKRVSLAIHYRARPDLAADCRAALEAGLEGLGDIALTEGKMVLEARPAGASKGTAVEAFLAEPPFAGRRPVVAGDDVTDEDAFAAVNAAGGVTIKIGPGPTAARHRLADPAAFLGWLGAEAAAMERSENGGN